MSTTGTYSLEDLREQRFSSAAEFGLDTINSVLQADLAYLNRTLSEQLSDFSEDSSDIQRIYGTSGAMDMFEVDEFGRAPTQKSLVGSNVAFPLRLYQVGVGWTSKWLQTKTPAELAEQYLKVRTGFVNNVNNQIKRALYIKDNYSFTDKLDTGVSLGVKRLINADSAIIPDSPAGTSFDGSTHDHYIARASTLARTDINSLVSTVAEHGNTRGLMLVVYSGDVADLAALPYDPASQTSGFVPLTPVELDINVSGIVGTTGRLATQGMDYENKLVGYWNTGVANLPVWVKPWAVDNYILCAATGMPEKVLVRRQRPQSSLQGLRLAAEIADYPLIAQYFEAEFGFGVWNRSGAAVLYTGATSWANPTLSNAKTA